MNAYDEQQKRNTEWELLKAEARKICPPHAKLGRICDIDGSNPQVFPLPAPQVISHITHHPDGRVTVELTEYGKSIFLPK